MNITRILMCSILGLVLLGCGEDEQPGLPNPASVFCEEQGGTVDIRTADDGSQVGYCVFADGTEVEEWDYYRTNSTSVDTTG